MRIAIYHARYRLSEKSGGRVIAEWPETTFEDPGPARAEGRFSLFRLERTEFAALAVDAPIGSEIVPAGTRGATWSMLRIYDGTALHAADVLRLAGGGERGFKLAPAQNAQPIPSREPAAC